MQEILTRKKQLRTEMKDRRGQMAAAEVKHFSQQIRQRVEELNPIQEAHHIMAFASINNEVDLLPLMEKWHQEGRTILLPRVEAKGQLEAVEWTGWEDIQAGPFGIREPLGTAFAHRSIDAVLVTGFV